MVSIPRFNLPFSPVRQTDVSNENRRSGFYIKFRNLTSRCHTSLLPTFPNFDNLFDFSVGWERYVWNVHWDRREKGYCFQQKSYRTTESGSCHIGNVNEPDLACETMPDPWTQDRGLDPFGYDCQPVAAETTWHSGYSLLPNTLFK